MYVLPATWTNPGPTTQILPMTKLVKVEFSVETASRPKVWANDTDFQVQSQQIVHFNFQMVWSYISNLIF